MTPSSPSVGRDTELDRPDPHGFVSGPPRRPLVVLCVTELTSWGILFYAFAVLAPSISRDTDWTAPQVTAAFSLGQVLAATTGIGVGRWLDRRGPHLVMTLGSVAGVGGLVVVATAGSLGMFFVGWAVAGVAMGAVLYPPAFAALTRWYGDHRVGALTALTLVGGLASTVFAPVTALLAGHLGWRGTFLVLAALLAVVTIPGHGLGLRRPWPRAEQPADSDHRATPLRPVHVASGVARSGAFLGLALAFSLTAFASGAVVVNLVPLLTEQGLDLGLAAVVLGLGGAGQVLGRLGYRALDRRTSIATRTVVVVGAVAITTGILGLVTSATTLLAAAAVAGVARGVFTLLQATAVSDRWGHAAYGRLNGLLSAPLTLAVALAPWGGSALAAWLGSYALMCLALAALAGLGAGVVAVTSRITRRSV